MDWVYGQAIGFLGNFFALMGNMGVELFELEWVSAIILFFSRLAWALFTVSVVVCAFECGIEYSAGRGNLQQCGMNIIKGFLAVSLFTVVPVRLYALSVSLQGTFSAGLTGYGRSIGEVGQDIITELKEIQTLTDVVNSSHFGLGIITSPIMLLFCVILMGYAVIKVFFANLKRGGILLIQIAVGSLYMFSVPRGYLDGFMGWVRQVIVPDRLPPVHHPHCGTHGVQGSRAHGRGAHALRWRSAAHRRQLRLGHHNKGQYYERRVYGAGCRQHHPNHRRGDQMKG